MKHFRRLAVAAAIVAVMALVGSAAPAGARGVTVHDNFYTPSPIPAYVSNDVGFFNNVGTTTQVCEPNHAGVPNGSSVWFNLRARNQRTLVRLNTRGSDFDTILAVYRGGNLCNVRFVAANDDCPGVVGPSCVQFIAQRNVGYRIAVAGYGGAQGSFRLRILRVRY